MKCIVQGQKLAKVERTISASVVKALSQVPWWMRDPGHQHHQRKCLSSGLAVSLCTGCLLEAYSFWNESVGFIDTFPEFVSTQKWYSVHLCLLIKCSSPAPQDPFLGLWCIPTHLPKLLCASFFRNLSTVFISSSFNTFFLLSHSLFCLLSLIRFPGIFLHDLSYFGDVLNLLSLSPRIRAGFLWASLINYIAADVLFIALNCLDCLYCLVSYIF